MTTHTPQLAAALGHWLNWPPETAWTHALPCLRRAMAEAVAAPTVDAALRAMGCRRGGMAEERMEMCREAAKEAM